MHDLNARLKAEQKNLERTRKQASPREREPELQRDMDLTAEKVPSAGCRSRAVWPVPWCEAPAALLPCICTSRSAHP